MPGQGIIGKQPTARFKDFADIGPDRRDIHDGFKVTDQKTEFPVFWGHDTTSVQAMSQQPNRYLVALAKAKKGRNLRNADLLWSRSGRLLVAERIRLNTARLLAIRVSEKALSNTWWPVATHGKGVSDSELDKIMALWFNSSLGLLTIVASRVDTQGAWVELKKPVLEEMFVLDPRKLSIPARKILCNAYDEIGKLELVALPNIEIDIVRASIDTAIAAALGIKEDFSIYRKLLAIEPVISGRVPGT